MSERTRMTSISLSMPTALFTLTVSLLWTFSATPAGAEPQDKGPQQNPPPKLSAEPKPPVEPKPSAEPKLSTEPKPSAEPKPSIELKRSADPKPSTEPKPSPEQKPAPAPPAPAKPDVPPEKEAVKKPMGSLILTVKLALLAEPRLFHYDVEVDVDQQTVTLAGHVAQEEDITVAAEVARSVSGVQSVITKLRVENTLAAALMTQQDERITALVKERFARSATLKAANFDVKTEDGIVLLSGTVRFQVIALEAAETARHVPGVRAVKTQQIRLDGEG